jgi:hypothetical protein
MSILAQILESALAELASQASTKNQKKENQDFKADFQKLLQSQKAKPSDDFVSTEKNLPHSFFEGKKGLLEAQNIPKERFFDDGLPDFRHEANFAQEQRFEIQNFTDPLGAPLSTEKTFSEQIPLPPHPLLQKLQDPQNIKDAILIAEILKRR